MARLLNEVNTGSYVELQQVTLGEYLETWLEHTRNHYCEAVRNHIAPAIGQVLLSNLQPLQIQGYYAKPVRNGRRDGTGGLSARTVCHHRRILVAALRQAVKWQLLPWNPCEAVEPPRVERKEM